MAYTNAWDNALPPGTALAKDIDKFFRDMKLDIAERMEDKFVEDWTADPLVLKANIAGGGTDLVALIPFSSFMCDPTDSMNDIRLGWFKGRTDMTGSVVASLPAVINPGCTVKKIEFLADKDAATQLYCRFYKRPFIAGGARDAAATLIDATTVSSAGVVLSTKTLTSPEVISPDSLYWFSMEGFGSDADFYIFGIRITYDRSAA